MMRTIVVAAVLLAGCTPHAEPELVVSFGGPSTTFPAVAVEGDRVHVFFKELNTVDLETGEVTNLGRTAAAATRYDEVAVSEGRAYWIGYEADAQQNRYVARLTEDGRRETMTFATPPAHLLGHAGCALFTTPPSLHRWCPGDALPVEVTADGPRDDVAADDEAYYFFASDGLTRLDIATGERTLLGVDPLGGAELTVDGDQLVWWWNEELRAIPLAGGAVVELGTLPRTVAVPYPPGHLTADEHGHYLGAARLRRGARDPEVWLQRGSDHAVADGHAVWLEGELDSYRVYTVPTDAASVAPPGGERGSIRPPFL